MSAYDYILNFSNKSKLNDYRQALVSYKRGTLSNGKFCEGMSLQYKKDLPESQLPLQETIPLQETLPKDNKVDEKKPIKIYQQVGSVQNPGLVFSHSGTEKISRTVATGGSINIFEEFSDQIAFLHQEDQHAWVDLSKVEKRKCFSRNIEEMIKKTDINYRTHGDRMHYLVLGLIKILDIKGNSYKYPLYMFSCANLNKNTLIAEIEQEGFINFWLDKNMLEDNLLKINGSFLINLDENFASKMNMVSSKLTKLQLSPLESISVDPQYSSLSIVTGFEPEYIDPAWAKILEN